MKILTVVTKIPSLGILIKIVLPLLIVGGLETVLPFMIQQLADKGIRHQDIDFVWLVLTGLLLLTLSRTVAELWRHRLLLRLPMPFYRIKPIIDLMPCADDLSRVDAELTRQSMYTLFSMVTIVVLAAVLCWFYPLVFGIFLAGSVLYGGWMALFLRRRMVDNDELSACQAKHRSIAFQMLTSVQEIKLHSGEWRIMEEWLQRQTDLYEMQARVLRLRQLQEAGCTWLNEAGNIVIIVFSAIAVIHGELTWGTLFAILYITGQLNPPIKQLTDYFCAMQDMNNLSERMDKVLKATEYGVDDWRKKSYKNGRKEMELQGVNFKYDPQNPNLVLQDVSFMIPEGKVTAIVGASGCGKTTIIKLLLQYYRIYKECGQGNIDLAGWFLSLYSYKWWYKHCGIVIENGTIFPDSVARNIAISGWKIDEERLMRAVEIACCKDFIRELPQQMDTMIGYGGLQLSQGEKQRILIARAVYKDPDFIFLDGATDMLDAKLEQQIVENLERFWQGKTVVVATKRLPMARHADQIVVLDGGRVAEIGTHDELVSKRGTYYELMHSQLGQ